MPAQGASGRAILRLAIGEEQHARLTTELRQGGQEPPQGRVRPADKIRAVVGAKCDVHGSAHLTPNFSCCCQPMFAALLNGERRNARHDHKPSFVDKRHIQNQRQPSSAVKDA